MGDIDWSSMFIPQVPLLGIVLRGSVTYLSIFIMLRLVLKRQSGMVSMTDVLLIVLIADAAQNGMADEYKSVSTGLVLVGTLVFWNFFLNLIGYYLRWFNPLVHPSPLPIIKDGILLKRNMRIEMITREELLSQLRERGYNSIEQIKEAYVEGNGKISVIGKK